MGIGDDRPSPQRHPHGGRHTDGRRTPDDHPLDRLRDRLEIGIGIVDLLARQAGLVDHDDGVIAPFNSAEGHG